MRRLFTGAEMAGIKIHAAIDTEIGGNHIYRTCRGIWLDWMAQGTRVTRNLLHDNDGTQDLFVEVNHGPFLVDNNICPVPARGPGLPLAVSSQPARRVAGRCLRPQPVRHGVVSHDELGRETPFIKPHSTEVAGLRNIPGGDDRFYNNILVDHGLDGYDEAGLPSGMKGNVFLDGAQPSASEESPVLRPELRSGPRADREGGRHLPGDHARAAWAEGAPRPLVTTELLGRAKVPDLPYVQPDGSPYRLDTDYVGRRRNADNPFPGPFERPEGGRQLLKVWPLESAR